LNAALAVFGGRVTRRRLWPTCVRPVPQRDSCLQRRPPGGAEEEL